MSRNEADEGFDGSGGEHRRIPISVAFACVLRVAWSRGGALCSDTVHGT